MIPNSKLQFLEGTPNIEQGTCLLSNLSWEVHQEGLFYFSKLKDLWGLIEMFYCLFSGQGGYMKTPALKCLRLKLLGLWSSKTLGLQDQFGNV